MSSHLEVVHVELSERQHVLVEDGIEDIDAEEILEDLTISPLVENEQSVGEGDQDEDVKEEEILNVQDGVLDQSHVE